MPSRDVATGDDGGVMTIEFVVVGIAQPQGSLRAFIPKGWRRPILTSTTAGLKSWRHLVADAASRALSEAQAREDKREQSAGIRAPRSWLLGHACEAPVRLTIACALPRPKSLPRRVTAHVKRPDLDKLVRACCDALSGVIWRDDSQIVELIATKRYAGDCVPQMRIRVDSGAAAEARHGARETRTPVRRSRTL